MDDEEFHLAMNMVVEFFDIDCLYTITKMLFQWILRDFKFFHMPYEWDLIVS